MRYVPNDKYTIAWFKLAECVAKGEKEKAFGVYRLLMHSFDDPAYAYQLEGDLLGAFQDQRAIEKYAHAAQLYIQNNRYKEAAMIYNDLITLAPDDKHFVIRLIDVYKKHKNNDFIITKLMKLADLLLEHNRPFHAMLGANELTSFSNEMAASVYTKCLINLSKSYENPHDLDQEIADAISHIATKGDSVQLQNLLSVLEQTNGAWHKYIKKLLKSI
jgi:transcription elongation factor GreA-like protein